MGAIKQWLRYGLIAMLKSVVAFRKAFYLPEGVISFNELDKTVVVFESDEVPVTRKLPVTIGGIHENFKNKLISAPWKTFVVKGHDWKVWGNQGAVLTDKNLLFKDVSREFDDKEHSIFKQFKLKKPEFEQGKTVVLAASGASVYYHWMFDILPRINVLKSSGEYNGVDKFIINFQANRFQTETLIRAGIAPGKIIASNDHWNFHLQAKELIVPSLASPNDVPSKAACSYLRSLFANEIKTPGETKKIYVQRLNGRRITNEDELLPFLKALDFEIVNPETLTVAEQASLFAGAEIVIGPHGAGLANIVFCKPGTIVIDLFAREWINPCYWVIAEHLDLRYGYLIGKSTPAQKQTPKGAHICADIAQLKALLKLFVIEQGQPVAC